MLRQTGRRSRVARFALGAALALVSALVLAAPSSALEQSLSGAAVGDLSDRQVTSSSISFFASGRPLILASSRRALVASG
jgi:hypothetical protein